MYELEMAKKIRELEKEIRYLKTLEKGTGVGALGTWQTYTPVVTSGTGTITSYTSSGVYCVIGYLVFLNFTVKITNKGSGSGTLYVSPPTTTSGIHVGVARENSVNGRLQQVFCHNNNMRIFEYAGSSTWDTGMTFYGNLFYRKGA